MNPARCLIALVALGTASASLANDGWIHVRVDSKDDRGESVRVNLPISLIQTLLPAIQDEHLKNGRLRIDTGHDGRSIDLRAVLNALRDTPDGNIIRLRDDGDDVRVTKSGRFLLVNVDERGDDGATVRVKLPLEIVDALSNLDDDSAELDLGRLLRALGKFRGEDLITVDDDEQRIRIWIDGDMDRD